MQPHEDRDGVGVLEQLEAISDSVLGAHEAPIRDASDGEQWERRGLLQRLVRHAEPE